MNTQTRRATAILILDMTFLEVSVFGMATLPGSGPFNSGGRGGAE
jgi:hypothetical protein